ncbi:MAG TPA: phosphomannomutase/phosphoglucomutase, partial [Rhodanobacteraceae bacterium]|nr:phosphomannomutase/phosphoglucomutase [Rhodanobacteraceae bacterium]
MNAVEKPARASLRGRLDLRRGTAELGADLAFALGVLLLLAVAFMGWQAWLIMHQAQATQTLAQAKTEAVQRVSAAVAAQRQTVERMLDSTSLRDALAQGDEAGRERAVQLVRALLPQAHRAAFYSPTLQEVLSGNLQQIGYARANQLLHAQSSGAAVPVEVSARAPRALSYVQPVEDAQHKLLGYAAIEMPFSPVRAAFESIPVGPGRLDLRQGDGSGDLVLETRGDGGLSTDADRGVPIPNCRLRIAAVPPAYWLPVTQSLTTAAALAVLALLAAIVLFVARARMRARVGTLEDEEIAAEALAGVRSQPAAATSTPAAAAAPVNTEAAAKPAPAALVERSIFRAYDIRGVVGKTLTPDTARLIGQAIGSVMREKNLSEIVVGRDGRLSGPQLSGALIEGLRAAGIDVIDIGPAATPLVYFASFHLNTGSCVAVTGSHNPPDYNGFKIVVGGDTLAEDAIQDLYARIAEGRLATGQGTLRQMDVSADYVQRIASDIQTGRS